MFELKDIKKSFLNPVPVEILKGISLQVQTGEWVSLMGPSGSGKSTLLAIMAGLELPTQGEFSFNKTLLSSLSEDERAVWRAENLGFVFQSFRLIPTLTVEENISLPLRIAGLWPAQKSRVDELIGRVGLGHRRGHLPRQLSGGEQQRTALARAFSIRPKLLLADEPTGNLDEENSHKVLDLLSELHRESKSTLIVVTHDEDVAKRAGRVFHLIKGELKTL